MPSPTSRARVASVISWVRSFAVARAPGGKAGHDSPSVHRKPGRLVAFSDGVFAIATTLLVLQIRPPSDYAKLLNGLGALWPSYLAYVLTFLFIGQVWANHHVMDRAGWRDTQRTWHADRGRFYGIAFDATALTFNAVWQYARRRQLLSETLDAAGATAIGRRFQLALAWLTAGALLGLLVPFLGVAVIAAFNVFYWLPIRGESPRPES
jgi:hypothetical protein